MQTSFLDYYKLILSKVSFDQSLLKKEYSKAVNILSQKEAKELEHWLGENMLIFEREGRFLD